MICAGKKGVEITTGKGGLPLVVLKHACGSKAEVRDAPSFDCYSTAQPRSTALHIRAHRLLC